VKPDPKAIARELGQYVETQPKAAEHPLPVADPHPFPAPKPIPAVDSELEGLAQSLYEKSRAGQKARQQQIQDMERLADRVRVMEEYLMAAENDPAPGLNTFTDAAFGKRLMIVFTGRICQFYSDLIHGTWERGADATGGDNNPSVGAPCDIQKAPSSSAPPPTPPQPAEAAKSQERITIEKVRNEMAAVQMKMQTANSEIMAANTTLQTANACLTADVEMAESKAAEMEKQVVALRQTPGARVKELVRELVWNCDQIHSRGEVEKEFKRWVYNYEIAEELNNALSSLPPSPWPQVREVAELLRNYDAHEFTHITLADRLTKAADEAEGKVKNG
jgi:hypothetical protein